MFSDNSVVAQHLADPLALAQRGNGFLTAQTLQHNADLFFGRILLAGDTADVLDDPFLQLFLNPGFLSHLRSYEGLR